jgi:choline dehydrogenase-like flavoprotein
VPNPGLNNHTRNPLAAAIVGGGSAVNGMFFDRGSAADYDAWEALGNKGWGFKDVLPYFKKSVTFTPPSGEVAERYNYTWDTEAAYGGNGEIQVSFPPYQFPGQDRLWDAWREIGVAKPKEAAAGDAIGAVMAPSALDPVTRTRSYARTAHYEPYAQRMNYHLLTGYQATEILFKEDGELEAEGVSMVKVGGTEKSIVKARKEVIVAAGAIWTPWLLQRSGVGPESVLEGAGIAVKKHLPGVGANFQDHPFGGSVWNWTTNPYFPTSGALATNQTFYAEAEKEYIQSRKGPLTTSRGSQAAFLPLKTVDPEGWQSLVDAVAAQDPTPYLPAQYDETLIAGAKAIHNITAEYLGREDAATFEFTFGEGPIGSAAMMRPLSRGTVNIDPANTSLPPLVDWRTFSNPLDIKVAVQLVRFSRRFNTLSSFSGLGAVELSPGSNVTSDAAIEEFLRGTMNPTFVHMAGTASMLPEEFGGVVGTNLKVHGVGKLSVVDASIVPYLPATHLCTTVYAIAEKAADAIKARTEWGN